MTRSTFSSRPFTTSLLLGLGLLSLNACQTEAGAPGDIESRGEAIVRCTSNPGAPFIDLNHDAGRCNPRLPSGDVHRIWGGSRLLRSDSLCTHGPQIAFGNIPLY